MHETLLAPEQDVVLSGRIRVSRNYQDLPFEPKMTQAYAEEVIRRTSELIFQTREGSAFTLLHINDLTDDARNRLAEHHLISTELLKNDRYAAAMVSSAGTVTVMLNEADHVRSQGLLPGLQLERSADMALKIDELLNARYALAFDDQWGYLSSNPANVGTGMRGSVILHLPALTEAHQIPTIVQTVTKWGLTLHGMNGDKNESGGQLYQLFNADTLGRSETDIVSNLTTVATQIAQAERGAREIAEKQDMLQLKDRLMRSWGSCMYALLMDAKEFMSIYSDIRYAICMGYLHAPLSALDALMMDLQPGSLAVRAGKLLGERESEICRAQMFREELKKIVME